MLLEKERKLLVAYGKNLFKNGLTVGTGGNLSIFNRKLNLVALTPSSIPYEKIKPNDICIVDLYGNYIECNKKPTSEIEMHLEIYRQRDNVNAIIHSHAKYSTIFAVLNKELEPILHVFGFAATSTVKVAPYATYGTTKMAKVVCETLGNEAYNVLLANHGNLSVGIDIQNAYNVLEELEFCAEIQWKAECIGKPLLIDDSELKKLINKFYQEGY